MQLSHIDLESKLFEGYKEDSMEFLDWLYFYLYNYTICSHLYDKNGGVECEEKGAPVQDYQQGQEI